MVAAVGGIVDESALMGLSDDALHAAARSSGVRLRVLADRPALYTDFAEAMLREVLSAAQDGRTCRLIVPVGPRGQYPVFVRMCVEGHIDLRHVWLFAMDEYLDWQGRYIAATDPLSFRGFLQRELVDPCAPSCGLRPEQLTFPDPLHLDDYSARIRAVGGIDCCFGGIGVHGHVAFNEPPVSRFHQVSAEAFRASLTRVVALAPETVVMNSVRATGGDFAAFPPMAVTAGMADIVASRRIRLYCDGGVWQRSVLRRALAGEPSVAWPVTLLRGHADLEVVTDADTAAPVSP